MISVRGMPEKVLPRKSVVFRELLPQADDVNSGAGVGHSAAQRVYGQTDFARCAVVGNGGILKTAKYGRAIDSHTAVFRANQAPVKTYEHYVGTKATFRILNKKWTQQYSRGDKMWLPLERGATLVASRGDPALSKRLIVAYPKRPDVTVVGLDSSVRGAVSKLMNEFRALLKTCAGIRPPGGQTPSSGIIMTVMALALCDEVTLYGFGNGPGSAGTYQYYVLRGTERRAGDMLHSMQLEHHLFRKLESAGYVKICGAGQAGCGLKANGGKAIAKLHAAVEGRGTDQVTSTAPGVTATAAAAAAPKSKTKPAASYGDGEAFRTVSPREFMVHHPGVELEEEAHPEVHPEDAEGEREELEQEFEAAPNAEEVGSAEVEREREGEGEGEGEGEAEGGGEARMELGEDVYSGQV